MTPERAKPLFDLLPLSPGIISNNRLGGGFQGDTLTPEQHIPPRGYPGKTFEVCMTMNNTWGFKKNDHDFKSPLVVIQMLSDIASKGGNFLLNIGPDREGVIPPESVACLHAVGNWMKVNGEAIYETEASPFPRRLPWGRVTQKPHADGSVTVYLHVWDWPAAGSILLPTLKELPASARLIQGSGKVTCETTAEGVQVNLPGKAIDPAVSVVVLEFAKPLTISMQAEVVPGKEGYFAISPLDADLFGTYSGNIQLKDRSAGAYLSGWEDERFYVEYPIRTPTAGKWQVSAEVASEKPSELSLEFHKTKVKAQIPATGGYGVWKQVELGVLELPQGETLLDLKPIQGKWAGANLRTLWLKPVSQ